MFQEIFMQKVVLIQTFQGIKLYIVPKKFSYNIRTAMFYPNQLHLPSYLAL